MVRNGWPAAPSMATKRYDCVASVFDGSIHAIGGYDGSSGLSSAERFKGAQWVAAPSMATK